MLLRVEPHGLFSGLTLSSSLLSAFFTLHPVVSALSHSGVSSSEQLSLISSGLALRPSRCAIRGCVKRLMKVTIYCTVDDSFIEDEQVHAFRFYTPSGESARSERRGKVFSKVSFANGYHM